MYTNETKRGTGRTTRMLEEAIKQAEAGRAVYVVGAKANHVWALEEAVKDICGKSASSLGIKFETAHTVGNFDWKTLTLRGAHPNCVVLVDHYAIEAEFARMLEMLHRFD